MDVTLQQYEFKRRLNFVKKGAGSCGSTRAHTHIRTHTGLAKSKITDTRPEA